MTCWPHSRTRRSSLSSEICFSLNKRTSGPQEDGAERAVLPPQRYGKGRAMAPLQRHLAAERELGFGCAPQILDLDCTPSITERPLTVVRSKGRVSPISRRPERNLAQITHAARFNPVAQNRPAVYFGR